MLGKVTLTSNRAMLSLYVQGQVKIYLRDFTLPQAKSIILTSSKGKTGNFD